MNIKLRFRHWLLHKLKAGRTEDELMDLVGRAEAVRSDEQRRMLTRVLSFHHSRVRELMVPRSAVKYIDINMALPDAEQAMREHGVSRLLVVDGALDQVKGVVRVWDLFKARSQQPEPTLRDVIHPCLQVSELQGVSGILSDMRKASHLAVVLDEFGGVAGVISLSDLLEEIVGPLDEKGASAETDIVHTQSGLEVQARVHVEDLAAVIPFEMPNGDFETLGGMITTVLGRIPVRGERVLVAGLDMHIQHADPRRVIQVLIRSKIHS